MAKLKFGAAKRDITPATGCELSGFIARLGPAEGIADPLCVRALVVEAGGQRAAIVQADVLGFPDWQVRLLREFGLRALGIPRRALLLSATHTHSGPGMLPLRGCPMAPPEYLWRAHGAMEQALAEAASHLVAGEIRTASHPFDLGVNRRQETPEGIVLGVAPDKPRPRELRVAEIRGGGQRAILFSHACHPYLLGGESRLISGDFPGQACQALEADGSLALFLNGCAGDIAPRRAFEGLAAAREEGQRLAAAVRAALAASEPSGEETAEVRGDHAFVHLPHEPLPSPADLGALAGAEERVVRAAERATEAVRRRIAAARQDWQAALADVLGGKRALDPVICELQGLQIGPVRLVAIAGEPFYAIGERIAAGAGGAPWLLGTANAYCGYIPTEEERAGGGYEVNDSWQYLGLWRLAAGAAARVETAAHRLATLHDG